MVSMVFHVSCCQHCESMLQPVYNTPGVKQGRHVVHEFDVPLSPQMFSGKC